MRDALAEVLQHPKLWRGDGYHQTRLDMVPTGHVALAEALPDRGWPKAAVTEIVLPKVGHGELSLLLPAIAALTQTSQMVMWIAPPLIPYPPALLQAGVDLRWLTWVRPASIADTLWAAEQALREPACGAVLVWLNQPLHDRDARRLQLAASRGGGCGFVLRQGHPERISSPFGLRLAVEATAGGIQIHILKRRGHPASHPVLLRPPSKKSHRLSSIHHAMARPAFTNLTARRASDRSTGARH